MKIKRPHKGGGELQGQICVCGEGQIEIKKKHEKFLGWERHAKKYNKRRKMQK